VTADERQTTTGLDRRDMLRLGGLIAALLVIVGVVLLAGGGGGGGSETTGRVQGVLTAVENSRLVLQPEAGGEPEEFAIRPEDQRQLDLFHLRQHAADSLPSIVHYEESDGTKFAVRVDDA
jgi:hypothetical protein